MERVVIKKGTFTDFAGTVRNVTFAAVSQNIEGVSITCIDSIGENDTYEALNKVLRIGVAVQNPRDFKANDQLAETIAIGKAKKDKSCFAKMFVNNTGLINQTVVEALLAQELKYFQGNPGKYIKGYNKDADLYKANPTAYKAKYACETAKSFTSSKVTSSAIQGIPTESVEL